MNKILNEKNLQFDFSVYDTAEKFDAHDKNPYGMKSVDFVAEKDDKLYFIEVKDYQNPNAPLKQRKADYDMLIAAGTEKKSLFCIEMGVKLKDSLLSKYSLGEKITKKIIYLLLINLDKLGERERGLLALRINGHVPKKLNRSKFQKYPEVSFELVNIKKLFENYGVLCSEKQQLSEVIF